MSAVSVNAPRRSAEVTFVEIIGDVAAIAPPQFVISASCTYELYPQEPCPHAGEFEDERLCD